MPSSAQYRVKSQVVGAAPVTGKVVLARTPFVVAWYQYCPAVLVKWRYLFPVHPPLRA